jgi:signal transduction histidine kinase/ligand-binding sensor domain-containing protein
MGNMAFRRVLLFRFSGFRNRMTVTLSGCLACILLTGAAHALDPNERITQYMHTSWRMEQDGVKPSGYGITQTSDGFLWFVSGDLMTFDGVRFAMWDGPPNYGSISKHDAGFGQIVNAFGDQAGGLWVFGLRGIVHLKGRDIASQFKLEGLRTLQNFREDPDGSLWVVRGNNSILDAPLCHVTERAVKCFGKADGIPISPINSMLADGKGGFWLGGQTALVHWHDGVSETYPIEGLKSNAGQPGIAGIARGPDGTLWVGILRDGPGRGLGRLTNGVFRPFVTANFDGSKLRVHNMIFDRDGNLWVGTTGQGIFRIQGSGVDHCGRTECLSSDTVNALFEDREGILWAATPDGIDNFRDARVTSFSATEGLGNRPMGVLASRDGAIWVASTGSLDRIERNATVSSVRTGEGLPGTQVTSMLEDRAGNMWVGIDDGLYLFSNGRFHRLPEPNHKPLGLVVGMAEDIDGNIWAECAGNPGKLVRIRDFQVREEFPAPQIPAGRKLAPDPQGGIWIGTVKGDLALFRHGALQTFPLNAKGDPFIRQIIANADGSVLAASAEGLVGLREGKVQRMTTKNRLPCNFVTSFIEDREKRWWLYTDCGIVELPDSELQRWLANPELTVQTRVYDELDGAQAGRPDYNSAALSSDGRVWFASGVWVQTVDPSRLSQGALPAVTYVESVTADRKEFAATNNLRLPPHLRDLQIDYTSPTFLIPQKVQFRYRLDPYDRDWKEAGTRRQAFYTNLPPRKYTFRVIAANSEGVWNGTPAKLDFSVAPAYYQTNWFRALCAAIVLTLVWAAYQWRVRRLRQQFEMTLEARVGERTRIARDLHDTLLQSFHGLLFRFQAVRNMLPNRPEQAIGALDTALVRAEQALDEGRRSIQELRPGRPTDSELDQILISTAEELASSRGNDEGAPRFEMIVEGERRGLAPMVLEEIVRIARELLRNTFQHARAHEIETELRYDSDVFRLIVRDDGKGIDPKILKDGGRPGHWGLPGVHERAREIGASLEFWSEVGAGTEVRLTIPAAIAYGSPRSGARFKAFRKRRIHEHQS